MIHVSKVVSPILCCLALGYALAADFDQDRDWSSAHSLHDFHARDLLGREVGLDKYRGQVVIVVNGATHCIVSAKSFKALQALYERHGAADNLRIVVFAIDGLMKESGSDEEIRRYFEDAGFPFDVYGKIVSDGEEAHPLYKWMRSQLPNDEKILPVSKILVDKSGRVVAKYSPTGPTTELEETMKQYF